MNVVVNGARRTVPERCTAAQLVILLECPDRGIAMAVDGEVLPRGRWETELPDGAVVEVLTAVQGG